jgi:hypothetical protein
MTIEIELTGVENLTEIDERFKDAGLREELVTRLMSLQLGPKDLPNTFVGVGVSLRSVCETCAAAMALNEAGKADPQEVWDTLRSAWSCLIDKLTDLALDKSKQIGMTGVQWAAFVMLAMFFENDGNVEKVAESTRGLIKKVATQEAVRVAEGGKEPTIN